MRELQLSDTLVYRLRKPTLDGRIELLLTPHQLLERLAQLVTPPRRHNHRYCGVLAPNARLRQAVTASAGPAGSTLQVIEQARQRIALPAAAAAPDPPLEEPRSALSRAASRCWALLLARHRRRRDRAAIPSSNACRCCARTAANPCASSRSCSTRR